MKLTSERPALVNTGFAHRDMTIAKVLAAKAAKNGARTFLTFMADGRTFSYAELDAVTNRIANSLIRRGVAKGDHVAVIMENCPEHAFAYLALGKIGAVAVPINTSARGRLLAYYLTHSDSVAVLAEAEFFERIVDALPGTPAIRRLAILEQGAPLDPALIARAAIPVDRFADLEEGSSCAPDVAVAFTDLANLAYTSGTTGPSKANMKVHASVVQYGMSTAEAHGYRYDDIVYVSLPLNHGNGYHCALWGAIMADASIALSRRFSVSRYWSEVRRSGATITNILGSMVNMLWSQPARDDDADNRLRFMVIAPVPKFALDWERRYATRVLSAYALSDYSLVCAFGMADPISKLGSAGRLRAGLELRIVDEHDMDLPVGEVGEIILRNNNPWMASLGYYKMPEATIAATRNLWWHTGDMAWVDADGFLYFADRKKDALRRRGENISAFEVESILHECPGVADVAVYAIPSEMSEDEVGASIVPVEGATLVEAEIIAFCARNMAHYMVPRYLHVTDDLPRTPSQKIRKQELRDLARAHPERFWDREKAGILVKR